MAAPITKDRATPEEVERRVLFIQSVMELRRWRTADEIECAAKWGISRGAVRKYSIKASRRLVEEYKKEFPDDETLRTSLVIKAMHTSDMAIIEGNPTTVTTEKITRDPNGDPVVTRTQAFHRNPNYNARNQGIELIAKLTGINPAERLRTEITIELGKAKEQLLSTLESVLTRNLGQDSGREIYAEVLRCLMESDSEG